VKLVVVLLAAALACGVPSPARAGQLGGDLPANCVPHTSFAGSGDVPGDYRCAGLAIDYHAEGAGRSPFPIWAGQWLFTDETGQFRVGSCTFNLGLHPTITQPSFLVSQSFPNDPTGALGAYLTWRYGDTTDDLTAAAMWAVLHYYAQDAAGASRAAAATAPLVPRLERVAMASGLPELQARAIELDAEARRFAEPWVLSAVVSAEGSVSMQLMSGDVAVAGAPVNVLVAGTDQQIEVTTDADGHASAVVPAAPGRLTVVATAAGPGAAKVYRGTPVAPDPQGAQTLVTGGDPEQIRAEATVDVAPPSTTTSAAPPTTTTTSMAPTTTSTTSTATTSTTEPPTTTTTTVPSTTTEAPTPAPNSVTTTPPFGAEPALPRTGSSPFGLAYVGTSMLVGGIGLVGTVRRRVR
jgi:LPXTG-motif cell wall-anchored protein